MKKILPFILIIITGLVLAACGSRPVQHKPKTEIFHMRLAAAAPAMAEAPMPAAHSRRL